MWSGNDYLIWLNCVFQLIECCIDIDNSFIEIIIVFSSENILKNKFLGPKHDFLTTSQNLNHWMTHCLSLNIKKRRESCIAQQARACQADASDSDQLVIDLPKMGYMYNLARIFMGCWDKTKFTKMFGSHRVTSLMKKLIIFSSTIRSRSNSFRNSMSLLLRTVIAKVRKICKLGS